MLSHVFHVANLTVEKKMGTRDKNRSAPKRRYLFVSHETKMKIVFRDIEFVQSYLERGRNIDPSMNTEPERSMYQLVASSPVLKITTFYLLPTCILDKLICSKRNELFRHEATKQASL